MSDEIATYTFLPWLRQGIVSKIKRQETLGADSGITDRASVNISLTVSSDDSESAPVTVSQDIQLVGPGDILGINPRALVRTEPRNWVTDFEPNYLAFIEFYEEDFLWRYTPAGAVQVEGDGSSVNDPQETKLRPWLFLMALEEEEFLPGVSLGGPLEMVTFSDAADPAAIFPPSDQAWAWAHVHVSKDITGGNTNSPEQTINALETLVRQNPDEVLSRLICPRKLKPNTGYHAFLIPAFEVGRLTGLGESVEGTDILAPSWGDGQTRYPVYYRWYFRTGERGDFEFLVHLLEARPVDERVGIRDMDMQKPEFGVTGMSNDQRDEPVMGLEGALKSPGAVPKPEVWPPPDPANHPDFFKELEEMVNLQDTLLNPPDSLNGHPDPVISPPLYGRWHAMQKRLDITKDGWANELNRDPRFRVPAGFGTQVIQTNQETYMQKAWQQLGDVIRVNQKIRQVQLAVVASQHLFLKHFKPLAADQQIAVTHQVHARVLASPITLFQKVKESRLPQAALSPTTRRLLRPRGVVMSKAVPDGERKPTDLLVRLNDGRITAAPPKKAPDKQISLARTIPAWVPEWLRKALASTFAVWVLLLLLVLTVAGLFIIGLSALSIVIAASLAGILALVERLRRQIQLVEPFRQENLSTEVVERTPPRPNFEITEPGQNLPSGISQSGESDSAEAANFRTALLDLHGRFERQLPQPKDKKPLVLADESAKIARAITPATAIPKRFRTVVAIPDSFEYVRPAETEVPAPVMAHPVFSDPMYKPLRDISSELLIPNLNLIPNNTITLLETNPPFIEAYMVGLNHEMASELLWRAFRTDQRGSYFRQFWDVSEIVNRVEGKDAKTIEEELRDIKPLHTWPRQSRLGTHANRDMPTGAEQKKPDKSRLVLVVRGDLLKKYPTTIIFAQRARWENDLEPPGPPRKIRVLDESNPTVNVIEPIFKAQVEPDLWFIGFNLTAEEAKGDPTPPADGNPGNPGYFIVFQEHPGEARFGLDILEDEVAELAPPEDPEEWNDLSWNHFGDPSTISFINLDPEPSTNIPASSPDSKIKWGANAADMAYILYQVPVMVAVHAGDMLA